MHIPYHPVAPSIELEGMPSLEVIEENFETYFYVTKKGMDLQLSDRPGWPFDDLGELRLGWHPDAPQS